MNIEPPFWFDLDERVVDTEMLTICPVSGIWLIINSPCLIKMAGYGHSQICPVFSEMCTTQRVVSGVR